jgi:hypothetical protein
VAANLRKIPQHRLKCLRKRCWGSSLNPRAETKIFKEEWLEIFETFHSIDQNISRTLCWESSENFCHLTRRHVPEGNSNQF